MENTGIMIAGRITNVLSGLGVSGALDNYDDLASLIYGECQAIANEQVNGDWIVMPNGDTYRKVFSCKYN
mgnify:CR=1 FL=1